MCATAAAAPQLQFFTDPGRFLAAAGDYLALSPVVNTVVTTMAQRLISQQAAGNTEPHASWWLVIRGQSGGIAGAGMRTPSSFPVFLLPMSDSTATALARTCTNMENKCWR
jgi:hypothetical protein